MMSLIVELENIVKACNAAGVDYAICGGLALTIHGYPRMTFDIDLLVLPEMIDKITEVVQSLGFVIPAMPMWFNQGTMEVRRFSKILPDGNVIPVDFLVVREVLQSVWDTRVQADLNGNQIGIVSKEGLITMKAIAGRPKDLIDIDRLQNEEDC